MARFMVFSVASPSIGSTGRLELALVGGNAARVLGIEVGQPVVVAWE